MKHVEIFTDGACNGNPGSGGYGVVLRYREKEKELSGGYRFTTNNRMEIMGALAGLEALKEPCRVTLVSDSRYLVDAVEKGWIYSWQKKGWRKSDKQPVLNADLWKRLLLLMDRHEVTFKWVRGHTGHAENERCDQLAVAAAATPGLPEDLGYESC